MNSLGKKRLNLYRALVLHGVVKESPNPEEHTALCKKLHKVIKDLEV